MRVALTVAVLGALAAGDIRAQAVGEAVGAGVGVARDGSVKISVPVGVVRVTGWEHDSVDVRGSAGSAVEDVAVRRVEERAALVTVRARSGAADPALLAADLEVRIPAASYVAVRTVTARVEVTGLRGGLDVETEAGGIRVSGSPRSIYAETTGGAIDLEARTKIIRARSVDGPVRLSGGRGFIEIRTVSGDVAVSGEVFDHVEIESVSGTVRFEGAIAREALRAAFETHGGDIEIALPAGFAADFEVVAPRGRVENAFGPGRAGTFSTGSRGPRISVRTFKGTIRLLATR